MTGYDHDFVRHSAGEYVKYLDGEKIHTNGIESFRRMLKRAHKGTLHRLSPKHLQRYRGEVENYCFPFAHPEPPKAPTP